MESLFQLYSLGLQFDKIHSFVECRDMYFTISFEAKLSVHKQWSKCIQQIHCQLKLIPQAPISMYRQVRNRCLQDHNNRLIFFLLPHHTFNVMRRPMTSLWHLYICISSDFSQVIYRQNIQKQNNTVVDILCGYNFVLRRISMALNRLLKKVMQGHDIA